jgi:spheroidene monooxygenase
VSTGRLISKQHTGGTASDDSASDSSRTVLTETNAAPLQGIVVILLSKLRRAHWGWGWQRIAFGSWWPAVTPGLKFMKTLGSGKEGGFGLMPSLSHQGMFCVFDSEAEATDFINTSALVSRYRERSEELFIATLRPASVRGSWDGMTLAAGESLPASAMLATLTRASIRPLAAPQFWRHAPAAQDSLADAPGCLLATGLGEAPVFRQATFSLWKNTAAMDAYARTGAHRDAISAAWKHQFFSESMFVRFEPLSLQGRWKGQSFD